MSSRLVSTALSLRTVTRAAALAAARYAPPSRIDNNRNTTYFAALNRSTPTPSPQVSFSPILARAKSLSHEIETAAPASSGLSWPVDVFAKAFEEDRRLDALSKAFVSGEKRSKMSRVWEPVEKELWLERYGGPGKRLERVVGNGTVVLREAALDGKGYLRVLI
ncbi:hypothetical protein C7974DRAFT_413960 [Boeremia exigua]|uniref:uncharacterized protein n=1 Tax=Boeremia exigua TaxID=749465 RepID=UPI001E8EB93C|nr:uncharacterized protein C7974DRAFT_413960 [Boeremia exigua]KAH6625442.1 hypothetical protein C7974DRAFT_413960 [Boeremia exigua]